MAIRWTDGEAAFLMEAASSHSAAELMAMFVRSATAIYQDGYPVADVPALPRVVLDGGNELTVRTIVNTVLSCVPPPLRA